MVARVAVILAAGQGERLGGASPKAFLPMGGSTMVELSLRAAAASGAVDALVVVAPPDMREAMPRVAGSELPVTVVSGGDTRQASVVQALAVLDPDVEVVAIHDAARPFASPELFVRVLDAVADPDGPAGAIPVIGVSDTIKRVEGTTVVGTEPREDLVRAQTPQAFRVDVLRAAHEEAARIGRVVTDDAAALEAIGALVVTVPGDPDNFKITTSADLARAELMLSERGAVQR